jgi:phosphotriesterase-related protein
MTTHPRYRQRPAQVTRRDALFRIGVTGLGLAATPFLGSARSLGASQRSDVTFPTGAIIRTLLRDVSPEELAGGATLFHEHLSLFDPRPPWLPPPDSPRSHFTADLDLMTEEVNATAADGVSCIVSGGTRDLGQNVDRLRELARRVNVHVVVAGGLWTQRHYPPEIAEQTEEEIAEGFLRDATTERWGAIGEIGSSMTMHPDERKVLRASCRVHLATGLPLFTHTPHEGCRLCPVEQLDIIESMGVDPRLVCLGHVSDITDDPTAETHKALAQRGAFLGFDTVGHQLAQGDARKVEMVVACIDAGFEDHVLLSSDFGVEHELKANAGAGYSSVLAIFVPKLRYAGVPDQTIQKILVDNPRRFLACVPK